MRRITGSAARIRKWPGATVIAGVFLAPFLVFLCSGVSGAPRLLPHAAPASKLEQLGIKWLTSAEFGEAGTKFTASSSKGPKSAKLIPDYKFEVPRTKLLTTTTAVTDDEEPEFVDTDSTTTSDPESGHPVTKLLPVAPKFRQTGVKSSGASIFRQFRQAPPVFCYDNPACGPTSAAWPGVCQTGTQQSPINLDGKDTTIKILPPTYRHFYELTPVPETKEFRIQNTGRTIEVLFPPGTEPALRGKAIDLPGDYRFAQLHFHWGPTAKDGTEHRILGLGFALELHIVHFSTVYPDFASASVAPNDPNAIAILAILFEEEGIVDNLGLKPITDSIPAVRAYNGGMEVAVTRFLNLKTLFPPITNFYRYEGSLTTPDCHENRVWTVFKQTAKISKNQMALFRTVLEPNNLQFLVNNHRPLQARNGRPISFYFVTTSLADWLVRIFVSGTSALRGFLIRPFNALAARMRVIFSRMTFWNGFVSVVLRK